MGRHRKANWYAKCVGKKMKQGKSMKAAAAVCKKKKGGRRRRRR